MATIENAGEFLEWLEEFAQSMRGEGGGNVPCGGCVACCTSSKFIHIRPTDTLSLNVIPKELMFAAPGLPNGHLLLGYDKHGCCPMFREGKCSIYEYRPETCKQYDCRVFAATQDMAYEESPAIKERIKTWRFKYSTNKSVEAQQAVNVAIKFLADNATRFPKGVVPRTLPQRAVMAIRIHTEFIGYKNEMDKEIGLLIDKITLKLSG